MSPKFNRGLPSNGLPSIRSCGYHQPTLNGAYTTPSTVLNSSIPLTSRSNSYTQPTSSTDKPKASSASSMAPQNVPVELLRIMAQPEGSLNANDLLNLGLALGKKKYAKNSI